MPIPKPKGEESEDKFISRCMSELNSEYPDEQQRSAICYDAFREEKHNRRWVEVVKKFIEKFTKQK